MAETFQGVPTVTIDGKALDEVLSVLMDRLVVDDHLHLPDSCVITLRDPSRDAVEKSGAKIGAKLEVKVVAAGRVPAAGDALFVGEITGLEADYDPLGQRITLRAYDNSHRMHRGRHTEAYRDKSDSDIAKKLAQRCGLKLGQVDESKKVHDHVSQVNLTDWEFIKARAREIGFEVGVSDDKFFFRSPVVNTGAPGPGDLDSKEPLALAFGADLLEFRPRISAAAQVEEVIARSWSYADKKAVIGRKKTMAASDAPGISSKPDVAAKFPTKPFVISDAAFSTQDEADVAATAMARQITAALGEADGMARGNTKIRAGAAATVSAVSQVFCGVWTVTSSRHIFDQTSYRTQFSVAGRQERSVLGLTSVGATSGTKSAGGPPIYGAVVGIVSDIKDPKGWHRARLTFPWLADDYETDWVRFALTGAGTSRGLLWLPEVGDEVLVIFEQGDVRRPYVIGSLFNGKDEPHDGAGKRLYDSSGRSVLRGWRSRNGHRLVFQDGWSGSDAIWIGTGDSKNKIVCSQSDRKIILHSDGSIEISGGGDVSITSGGSISLEAQRDITMKAKNITVKGDVTVDIDSALITLN
jgi:phage protein D/phage baseplate assembly protein gpV